MKYYTTNSVYEFDLENMLYRRLPQDHAAFEAPEMRNPQGSHRLVDAEWLPLKEAPVVKKDSWGDDCLHFYAVDSVLGIFTSPIQKVEE